MSRLRPSQSFAIAAGLLLLDFLAKRFVLAERMSFSRGIDLIPGVLRFTYVRNAGAAFGIFQGGRWPFIAVSLLAVIALVWVLRHRRRSALRTWSYALILGGAAGNLVDRVFYGGRVIDFIEMSWHGHVFPVYNFADMGVSIGAALLILALLREPQEPEAQTPESQESGAANADSALADRADDPGETEFSAEEEPTIES